MEVGGGDDRKPLLERKQASYRSLDDPFVIRDEKYKGQQYSQIYFMRLHNMRNLMYPLVPKWKPQLPVCTVLGLEEGKECIIVGTIYKHMKLKPSILDEYSKERSVIPLVKPHNFMHPDDHLVLEDESGRVKLAGSILAPSAFVTGIVMAVHGKERSDGDFLVEDILVADLPSQIKRPIISDEKYVVFISGLRVGGSMFNPLKFQLLVDHITGHLGDDKEQRMSSEIVRVVIAGSSIELPKFLLSGQMVTPKEQSKIIEPIKELDMSLTQLVAALPVDIMPGTDDPANFSLPQQPLNMCLFPGASAYNTFVSCTNPHSFELDNVLFLGTSGQNIDDLGKYSDAKDKLEFMERTLRWRHLAPTAPNTLGCYPFTDRDPFLIESCPHVYFCGNQDNFDSRLVQGPEGQSVRLICIPRFCETGTAIMVYYRSIEAEIAQFKDGSINFLVTICYCSSFQFWMHYLNWAYIHVYVHVCLTTIQHKIKQTYGQIIILNAEYSSLLSWHVDVVVILLDTEKERAINLKKSWSCVSVFGLVVKLSSPYECRIWTKLNMRSLECHTLSFSTDLDI